VHQGADVTRLASTHRIETLTIGLSEESAAISSQLSNELSAVKKRQMLKKESWANIKRSTKGKYQLSGWRSGLKKPEEVSEVAREHRPDELGKGTTRPSKTPLIGGGRTRAFEFTMIGQSTFYGWQNFHSTLVVAPVHFSTFSRVSKS
jgi:hypothetical protein